MIGRVLGFLALPALLVGLVWLAVVIWFQQTQRDIDADGIVLWFGLLPLGIVLLWFVLRFAWRRITAPAAVAAAPDGAASVQVAAVPEDPTLRLHLALIAAEVHTPGGAAAAQLLPAMADGSLRPELSTALADRNGLPVRVSACDDVDGEAMLDWVEKHLAAHPLPADVSGEAAQAARMLAMLEGPLMRALDSLTTVPPLPLTDAAAQRNEPAPRRPLVCKIFAPAPWHDLIAAWLREQAAALPGFAFGVVRADADRPALQADALRVADAFCAASAAQQAQAALLLVGCDSQVSAAQIEALESSGQLFAAHNQSGQIPGEAAAVVVALPAALAVPDAPPLARLHRAASGARQKPVNSGGRVDAGFLGELARRTLQYAALPAEQVGALVSDCEQRSAWMTECAALISTHFIELDPVAQHLAAGQALGNTGAARSVLALALATHQVSENTQAVLLASVADPLERSAVALSPWTPSEP